MRRSRRSERRSIHHVATKISVIGSTRKAMKYRLTAPIADSRSSRHSATWITISPPLPSIAKTRNSRPRCAASRSPSAPAAASARSWNPGSCAATGCRGASRSGSGSAEPSVAAVSVCIISVRPSPRISVISCSENESTVRARSSRRESSRRWSSFSAAQNMAALPASSVAGWPAPRSAATACAATSHAP